MNYFYLKANCPKNEAERKLLEEEYKGLSMLSAVSSLLYAALITRYNILWITKKLAKLAKCPGKKDFQALMHVFGYLRKFPDYAVKFYSNLP